MASIDIRELAPDEARIYADGDLVGEIFRDESAFEDEPAFYTVHLSEDPRGPRRVYAREHLHETVRWMVDSHPVW